MKSTTKNIILNEGIEHIENLPIKEFLNAVKNLNKFRVTEKIDGVNIVFGMDENGKFYTSRESKGGKRFYKDSEWGKQIWITGFRAAHKALEKIFPVIKRRNLMKPGDAIEAEILFGALPNTVPYGSKSNQIILLRVFDGNPDFDTIKKALENISITIELKNVPTTNDGKTIEYEDRKYKWKISSTPQVPKSLLDKVKSNNIIKQNIKKLEEYLNQPSGIGNLTNLMVISIPLNKKPEAIGSENWKIVKEKIKIKREQIEQVLQTFKLDIKNEMLNSLVRKVASKFGPSYEEGGWIEGLVFLDTDTGKQFKLVDKTIFTEMNKFSWKIREIISASGGKKLKSLMGRIQLRMAEIIGHPRLVSGFPKQYISKFGTTDEEIINNLSKSIQNLEKTKEELVKIINYGEKVANRILDWYIKNKSKLTKTITRNNQEIVVTYDDPNLNKKTLETFAEFFYYMKNIKNKIMSANTPQEIITLFMPNPSEEVSIQGNVMEKAIPINEKLWKKAIEKAKKTFKVYPSAYANGFAAKEYKRMGGKWKNVD